MSCSGDYYLCLRHQYDLKCWVHELNGAQGMALKYMFDSSGHAKAVGWARQEIKDAVEKVAKRFMKWIKNAE